MPSSKPYAPSSIAGRQCGGRTSTSAADVHREETLDQEAPVRYPAWSSKLVQEVIRLILEAYYEPQFSDHSHGFRRGRGCHTALSEVHRTWNGTRWFIEGDPSQFFDSLEHEVLVGILAEKIHDAAFCGSSRNSLRRATWRIGSSTRRSAVFRRAAW